MMKMIEVLAREGQFETIRAIVEQFDLKEIAANRHEENEHCRVRALVSSDRLQNVTDTLLQALGSDADTRIIIEPVDSVISTAVEEQTKTPVKKITREQLFSDVRAGASLDRNYVWLVILSTFVAAIGLLENNVAVIVGAMVIAPLLGPNLALSLGMVLGDRRLVSEAMISGIVGLVIALAISIAIGALWPADVASREVLGRTHLALDGMTLALAAGAAGVLSLTTGLPAVLVGVMVAVALLPPTVVFGMTLGQGQLNYAMGSAIFLVGNIVCLNLAANLVFSVQGLRPRTWIEQRKARQSRMLSLVFWCASLAGLIGVIWFRGDQLLPGGSP